MVVYTSTDFGAPRIAGLGIMVSREGATTTIALDGEWDLAQRENVRHAVRDALARHRDRVVLDLNRLTFMDATGVHGVLDLASRAARLKIDVVVIPGPEAVQRLFEICQLPDSIAVMTAA